MQSKMVSESAEATVISTILRHPEFTLHSEFLKPRYFYNVENGCWLWAINELYKAGITNIDALNITNMIESNAGVRNTMQKKNVNIEEYIDYAQYAGRDTLEEYMVAVKDVVTMAYKRDMDKMLEECKRVCNKPETTLKELETFVNKSMTEMTENYITDDRMEKTFGENVYKMWEEVEAQRNKDGSYGIQTIFPILTEYGLVHERGEMILIMAQRKEGKSLLLMNELIDKLKMGMCCIYHDTEMSDRLFMLRMLANLTGIEQSVIKSGRYSSTEKKKIDEALDWLSKVPFKHIYAPAFNEIEIMQQYKTFRYKFGADMMGFYDYFKATGTDSSINYNQLGTYANFMKNEIAGGLDIPILAAAQLNRQGQVADSYKLEQIASAGLTYRRKTQNEIKEGGGLKAGNYVIHIDFARSATPMDDDEFLHVSVDGARMRAEQAEVQPKSGTTPFDDEEEQADGNVEELQREPA